MKEMPQPKVELIPYNQLTAEQYDLDHILFDLDSQIDLLSSQTDCWDYLVSVGSGILCGLLDVLWVGEFNLERGRSFASDQVDAFVQKTAKLLGWEGDDLKSAIQFLEKKFPIPSDRNTPDFGGGLQHHLRDFAHHPTIVGLAFSLLTQFTYKSYGTNTKGAFVVVDVPEAGRVFIGEDMPTKILYGTIIWFFHMVSDMAGSSGSIGSDGKGAGTGIPGPLLSLLKELSALPIFQNIDIGENSLSKFLSKLFNGTLLAKHDESGKIIKDTVLRFDLRGELGAAAELGRQALPVIANESVVRSFYLIRRLALALQEKRIYTVADMQYIDWDQVKPTDNPTIARMLVIASGVFTAVDVGGAVITQKYWVSINYINVGRFAVAIGEDISWCLKARKLKDIRAMYETVRQYVFMKADARVYERIGKSLDIEKFGLTAEQTELLYNLEYHMTLNDIQSTKLLVNTEGTQQLKREWLDEWRRYISEGFSGFLQISGVEMHWYTQEDMIRRIEENAPEEVWFRLVLLEAMLFEPYFPMSFETDKKGNQVPCKKYDSLRNGFNKNHGDHYLDTLFSEKAYYKTGYIKRLRKCHDKVQLELNEVLKTAVLSLTITAGVAIAAVFTAGALAPAIAVALVGSNFAGLSGAALTSACLAYLGGGAIAAGGAGMAGGTIAIVGGGAALGLGVGAGVGSTVGAVSLLGKKNTIVQSAKLITAVREIFLNDEYDVAYSNSVYEAYVQNIIELEKGLVDLKYAKPESEKEKKEIENKIKRSKESVKVMGIAMGSMEKFISSFEEGLTHT